MEDKEYKEKIYKYLNNLESGKERIIRIRKEIREFYKSEELYNRVIKTINGESSIKLRFLDYYLTFYIKEYNKNIWNAYKYKILTDRKKNFDLFQRVFTGCEIMVLHSIDMNKLPTNAQLNMFKFIFEYNVLENIIQNYETIKKNYNLYSNKTT